MEDESKSKDQLDPNKDYFDPSQTPPRPEIYNSPKKIVLKFIVVFGIMLIIILGIGYWIFKDVQFQLPNQAPSPTPTAVSPTMPPDPTANWKTYRNDEYGFEFKYPSDWVLDAGNKSILLTTQKKLGLSKTTFPRPETGGSIGSDYIVVIYIEDNQKQYMFNESKLTNNDYQTIQSSHFTVNNINGKKYQITYLNDYGYTSKGTIQSAFIFQKNNLQISTLLMDSTQNLETFDQILSTFKLIE